VIDEFELIRRIAAVVARRDPAVEVGIGDDAAVLHLGGGRRLLLTTDALVSGVHFDPAAERPEDVGWRAVAANVSDVAAMGGAPRWILVSLVAPPDTDDAWVEALHRGIAAAAAAAGAVVVGGNLARGRDVVVNLALAGETSLAPLRRDGARAGDGLYLTGPVGASAAGRAASGAEGPDAAERRRLRARYLRPPLRLDAAAVLARVASAAIDVSDGLVQDLGHLVDASRASARIFLQAVPLAFGHPRDGDRPRLDLALGGGEDYELIAAIPPRDAPLASRLAAEGGVGLYRIGDVTADPPPGSIVGVDADGSTRPLPRAGFRHFG
jgi:thiamine-monophosphate kinase